MNERMKSMVGRDAEIRRNAGGNIEYKIYNGKVEVKEEREKERVGKLREVGQ